MSGIIKSLQFTEAWGINAGTGQLTILAGGCSAMTPFSATLGGKGVHGIITKAVQSVDASSGTQWTCDIADNRIRLTWDFVTAIFNKVEIIAKEPGSDPTKTRRRRYWHIYPDDWKNQKKTYTNKPHSARDILEKVFEAEGMQGGEGGLGTGLVTGGLTTGNLTSGGLSTGGLITGGIGGSGPGMNNSTGGQSNNGSGGSFKWTFDSHAKLKEVVYDVDAGTGMELANFLQMIADRLGLLVGLSGRSRLKFATKGEGSIPSITGPSTKQLAAGSSISQNKTSVLVIGDRNLYQDINVELVADWKSAWLPYILEPAFLDAVGTHFGPFDLETPEGRGERAARAREVTVAEFAKIAGPQYMDYGRYGETTRGQLPAWFYVNEIVLKAYRIPYDYTLLGKSLSDLEIHEGLLQEVDYDEDSGEQSYLTTGEYYPDDRAHFIAQGVSLDMYDPSKKDFVSPDNMTALKERWRPVNRFRLDLKNKCVIFDEAIFNPGEGATGLFIWANADQGSVPADHPSKYLVKPNASALVTAATVKGSFTFEAERYSKQFGGGARKSSAYVGGLAKHVICENGQWKSEIKYDTEPQQTADEKSAKAVTAYIAKSQTYLDGRFTRLGGIGLTLNGCIDRITSTVDASGGVSEDVDFTKERGPNYFDSERELERRKQTEEIFPGQRALQQEAREYRHLGRVLAGLNNGARSGTYQNINDVLRIPIGNDSPGTTEVYTTGTTYDAGDVLWSKATTAATIGGDGAVFVGVVVAQNAGGSTKPIYVARQGVVPVKVKGPFLKGQRVYCKRNETTAVVGVSRTRSIGTVMESYTTEDETMLVPVKIDLVNEKMHPFEVYIDKFSFSGGTEVDGAYLNINPRSTVLKTEDVDDDADITDLTTNFKVTGAEKIWLEATFDHEGAVTTIERKHGADGWEDYPTPWKTEGEGEEKTYTWFQLIAYVSDATEEEQPMIPAVDLVIHQCTTTHLIPMKVCFNEESVIALVPWHGAFSEPDEEGF